MKRRQLIKQVGMVAGAFSLTGATSSFASGGSDKKKNVFRIAHITDVHIRPELNAPQRFRQCMKDIEKHKVDFFLNGGDTIYAADYENITRERVNEQWAIWKE